MKYANLHLHSTYSDGTLTPYQLLSIGKSLGYRALALTDHETDGGVPEFMSYAHKEGGIDTISGMELYGMYDGFNLHLTALDFDMDNPTLRAFVNERIESRYEATRKRVLLGIERGYIDGVSWDDIERFNDKNSYFCVGSVVRAYRVLRIPVPENLNQNVFKSPEAKQFAASTPTAEEVIRIIRGAGGIIALAHPYKRTHMIEALVGMGLNGVEISHPDNRENTSYLAIEAAKEFNLYHCGGTDHFGAMSGLGGNHAIPALHGITEEEYYILKERRRG